MYKIILVLVIVAVLLIAFPKSLIAQDKYPEGWCGKEDYKCLVDRYTTLYGSKSSEVEKVLACESRWRVGDYGDHGAAFGIAQFHKSTFASFSEDLGEKLDYYSAHDQIKLISWAFAHGLKSHWTCFKLAVK